MVSLDFFGKVLAQGRCHDRSRHSRTVWPPTHLLGCSTVGDFADHRL